MFEKPFRLHFSSVFENTFKACWFIIVLVFTSLVQNLNAISKMHVGLQEGLISTFVLLGIVFLIFIFIFVRWRRTYISLSSDTILIDKRFVFNASKTTIGIKNISTVNLEQNIFERIVGTCQLKIDTNSLSTANETDVKIILKKSNAEAFRKLILSYINQTNDSTNTPVEESVTETYDIQFDFETVIKHTVLSIPIFSILYIVFMIGLTAFGFSNHEISSNNSGGLAGTIVLFLFIGIPVIYSMFSNLFKLYDFKAKRVADKIHISYGLFTKHVYTIPVKKINAVIVKQPTLARLFKQYSVELVNIGMGEGQNETPVAVLMCSKKDLLQYMQLLLPELEIRFGETPQPKKAILPIAIKTILVTAIFSVACFLITPFLLLATIPFGLLVGILMYITRAITPGKDYVSITNGIFARKTILVSYGKIQKMNLMNSFVTQPLKIQKCRLYVLASAINVEHYTGYFEEHIFENISSHMITQYSKT